MINTIEYSTKNSNGCALYDFKRVALLKRWELKGGALFEKRISRIEIKVNGKK